ncbi:MAG: ATPase, T2SS/T4P/T4SS family, partial [Candidatus Aenigmatarchaeota archaeon]
MLKDYEDDVRGWFDQLDLEGNPFTLDITPSLFVGYTQQLKKLAYHIEENHKFALVTGATGSGKTTLLKLIEDSFSDEFNIIYLSKPPDMDSFVDVFMEEYPPSFFERIFGLNVSIHDISDYLNKKTDGKLLIMVDEAHESDVKTLQWLRTVTDQVEGCQLILAGLPSFEEKLKNNLETMRSRITTK